MKSNLFLQSVSPVKTADDLPLLKVRGLTKRYGQKQILDIDKLDLYAGQAVLLSGKNGAGKSTLMKILAGIERYNEGSLYYKEDRNKEDQARHQRFLQFSFLRKKLSLSNGIIYLHQHPFLFDISVRDNLAYGLKCQRMAKKQQAQIVQKALNWSGLEHLADRNAKTLSGGEMQRIALARAWVLDPKLLLLDEPTANMDTESREQTSFLIRRLINQGTGVVICSHETKPDNRLIDRVLHLDNGKLIESSRAELNQTRSPDNETSLPKTRAAIKPCKDLL
ncbi:energy-coupling factor ABC transporter ATP-binding protein [Motiliproteus sp. MSK22-1]|uniref:energy-coupling factor ABC transporter ATP-binding protein n=1 Tax=Motiliproteus sp. MSK22-1 TaxID=1897630 RepID=UPI000975F8A5|nr:ABC transporter ATP-binding protein [Motiliproteus sp. MSK22-1]OMH29064.1 hypothetical protein BGP75_20115 [Motiliproteus sp. MSK22-1]